MATTPTVVTASTNPIAQWVTHWTTLIKAHEKLLIVAILALVLWHFGDEAYNAYGKHVTAQQTADNAQIAQLEKQNAANELALTSLKAQVDAQAKVDAAKIVAAKQSVITQQKIDAALPLPQLSERWVSLLSLPEGSVTPQANGTIAVTTDAAHTTVNALEQIGPLTIQLSATQDQLAGCTTVRAQQDTTIKGLTSDIAAEKTGRAEDAKVAKVAQHKSFRRGFKYGLVVGIFGTIAAIIH